MEHSVILLFSGAGLMVLGMVVAFLGARKLKNVSADAPPKLDLGTFGINIIVMGVLVMIVGGLVALIK